jgi:hypothetical protein
MMPRRVVAQVKARSGKRGETSRWPCCGDSRRTDTLSRMTANLDPVDVHVGACIHRLRTFRGMSLPNLGRVIGLTDQQVQKYETGTDRVFASRPWDIAAELSVPVSFFFDDMPPEVSG